MNRLFFFICLALTISVGDIYAFDREIYDSNGARYRLDHVNETATLIGSSAHFGDFPDGKLIIPAEIKDYAYGITCKVTHIGEKALVGRIDLTELILYGNSNVVGIGKLAFLRCIGLHKITIYSDNLKVIEAGAFYGCTSLTSVTIPNSVVAIGSFAFYECTNLTSVTIGNNVTYIGESAFERCDRLKEIRYPEGLDLSNTNIPPTTKLIPYYRTQNKNNQTLIYDL